MTSEKCSEVLSFHPAYVVNSQTESINGQSSKKSKALFGYSVAVTTALVVVLVMGGVYYYRSIDVLQESIKKFRLVDNSASNPVEENVEIDMTNNYAVFHLTGSSIAPGTVAALDYTKSMTGIYEPRSRRCYLIGGIKSEISDLQTLSQLYEKNTTFNEANRKTFRYVIGSNYPVSDKKILPGPLKNACTSLPVYWLEPAPDTPHGIQKRAVSSYPFGSYCYCLLA